MGLCIFNASKAEITALYVSPENAGMGIGRTLVQEVEAMAREAGVRELNLKSTLNAVGFYERMSPSASSRPDTCSRAAPSCPAS